MPTNKCDVRSAKHLLPERHNRNFELGIWHWELIKYKKQFSGVDIIFGKRFLARRIDRGCPFFARTSISMPRLSMIRLVRHSRRPVRDLKVNRTNCPTPEISKRLKSSVKPLPSRHLALASSVFVSIEIDINFMAESRRLPKRQGKPDWFFEKTNDKVWRSNWQ